MPELPEVEIIRKGLSKAVVGKHIQYVSFSNKPLRIPIPNFVKQRLQNAVITAVCRRSKYLIIQLDNFLSLVVHLGMSGTIRLEKKYIAQKHDHMCIYFSDATTMIFNDPRRFGLVKLVNQATLYEDILFNKIGIEPLEKTLNVAYLEQRFSRSSKSIKAALLDQSIICGIGNIYACEILFLSKIHPQTIVSTIPHKVLKKLIHSIQIVLKRAIQLGGSSLNDYYDVDGKMGYFLLQANVYGKAHSPCKQCKKRIELLKQSNRSTYYCPQCQSAEN